MIKLENLTKTYHVNRRPFHVLSNVSTVFPARARIGILGANGAGKTTLLRLISGAEQPSRGRIRTEGCISFPLGFTGTFHNQFSGRENVQFLCDIYDMDYGEVANWIEDFAELGDFFDMPVGTYSSGMWSRISFATSFAFDFDIYLVDEAIEVGDARFRRKCAKVMHERLKDASLLLVSQNAHTIREYCTEAAVLQKGNLTRYSSVDDALDAYEAIMRSDQAGVADEV